MSENMPRIPSSNPKKTPNNLNTLTNIDQTIARSRQIVQNSKSLTVKNNQRKALLEQRYKQIFSPSGIIASTPTRSSMTSPSYQEQKIPAIHIKSVPQAEIEQLRLLLKEKDTEISGLKSQIGDMQRQNQKLKNKLKFLVIPKSGKKKQGTPKLNQKSNQAHIDCIQKKLKEMEQKFLDQQAINRNLRENHQMEGGHSAEKIEMLEKRLILNSEKYLDLQKRLQKTENVIKKDLPSYRKRGQSSRNLKVKKKVQKPKRKRMSENSTKKFPQIKKYR